MGGSFVCYLLYDTLLCLASHGLYSQVTVASYDYTYWTPIFVNSSGTEDGWENDSGQCLRVTNSLDGEVSVGVCNSSDDNDDWFISGNHMYNLALEDYGYLGVEKPKGGSLVKVTFPDSNYWWSWML